MSVKSYWYTNYYKQIYSASPAYGGWKASGGDTFRIALCPPAYRPNQDTHAVLNDITQVTGQGYTAGGQVLTGKTISVATGSLVLGANPVSWAGCVFTVRYAVIYDDTNASPLQKQLVRWIDFGQDIQLAGDTILLTFDGAGDVIITPPSDVTPPLIEDASVNGPTLTLSYGEQLDTTSVPAPSAYVVLVNAVPATVSTTAVSSIKVTLVLATAVVAADVVSISYTVPATGMVRDLAFNPAAALSGLSVLNVTTPEPPDPPPPDVTPPVVAITSPADLAVVSDTITVTATATDLNGVVSVVLYVDGVAFSTDTSSPYSFGMDTKTLSNGAHALVARAIDPSGNIGVSATVNVTVSNVTPPPPDTTPPSVTITLPLPNAYLAGTYTVSVTATDNVGVVSSTLYVDGVSQGVDPTQPYSFSLNTLLFTDGLHTLVVTAIDAAGNTGTSTSVPITVDNTTPVLSSASINGASLQLNYNETLNTASVPLTTAFSVKTDGNSRTLNSVSISGLQVLITLSVAVLAANVVTVSYTAPTGTGAKPVQDQAGNNAANLTNQAVTNATPGDTTAPVITSMTVNAAALVIQYSETLDSSSVPATAAFAIMVNGSARGVSTVAISGSSVTLTLASAVISTDTVIASYSQPLTNKIRDLGQVNAASFFNLPVANITAVPATDIASFVSQSIPAVTMVTGGNQTVGVTMRNDGTATWTAPAGYHLYSQNPAGNTNWGLSQVAVPGSVPPNGNAAFSFGITAPSTAGTYNFQWRMRHTATEFGSQSVNTSITVSSPTPGGIFVSTTGDDANGNGSQSNPYRTLNKALGLVQPSGSVQIRGGTYIEGIQNNCPGGTSWVNSITVTAFNNEPVTLKPSSGFVIWLQGAVKKYIIINGLVLDAINAQYNTIKLDRPSAGTDTANHIRVSNCELKNNLTAQALLTTYASDFNEFQNLTIHNNGKVADSDGLYGYAMYIKGSSNIIERCTLYDQGSSGIQIFSTTGASEPPNSNIIRNNIIRNNCVLSAAQGRGAGITVASGSQNLVYNNLVYSNFRGISCSNTFTNKILYNSVYSNPDIGIYLENGGSHVCRNNICYQNGTNFFNTSGGGTVTPNVTTQNPLFVNATAGNFHLLIGSPAINTGAPVPEVTTDYDSVTRGNPSDQGAYEFV